MSGENKLTWSASATSLALAGTWSGIIYYEFQGFHVTHPASSILDIANPTTPASHELGQQAGLSAMFLAVGIGLGIFAFIDRKK
jgi:hypothetical protein